MAGPQFKLDNLIAIIDRNNLQQTGTNESIMSLGNIASKWKSFGWEAAEIDGHNISEYIIPYFQQNMTGHLQ